MTKERRIKSRGLPGVRTEPEFTQQLVDLARVTRVVKGGKRLSFRACMVIGNNKGEIGMGVAKGTDVAGAIHKAVYKANKDIIKVTIVNDTIPHWVRSKYGAALVLLRPARKGHGIVAGGAVRMVLSVSGIKNVTGKILGSKSKINNVKATFKALQSLKVPKV